jgi:hypothetical protein
MIGGHTFRAATRTVPLAGAGVSKRRLNGNPNNHRRCSSKGRAPVPYSGGCGFNSMPAAPTQVAEKIKFFAPLTQWTEFPASNRAVGSSNLSRGAKLGARSSTDQSIRLLPGMLQVQILPSAPNGRLVQW